MFSNEYLICGGWRHPPHPTAGGGTLPGPLESNALNRYFILWFITRWFSQLAAKKGYGWQGCEVWFMEWIQDCWLLVGDGVTDGYVFLIGCVSVGCKPSACLGECETFSTYSRRTEGSPRSAKLTNPPHPTAGGGTLPGPLR
ncbi:MAG: hypothetical protein PVF83_01480 [Anaerolineales bacterium]